MYFHKKLFIAILVGIISVSFLPCAINAQTTPPPPPEQEGTKALSAFLGTAGYGEIKCTVGTVDGQAVRVCRPSVDVRQLIVNLIRLVLSVVGMLFFVMIFYAGYLWMSAGGNDEDVKKAQEILQRAITGFVLILVAYALTTAIGSLLTKAAMSQMNAPGGIVPSNILPFGN